MLKSSPVLPQMQATIQCPLCKASTYRVSHVGVRENPATQVYECDSCGIEFIEVVHSDLRKYYQDEYRKTHSSAIGKVLTPQQNFELMQPLMERRVMFFEEHIPPGAKVLEVGCSAGYFLDSIRAKYTVFGTDFNEEDARFVRDKLQIACDTEDVGEAFPGQKFTVICAYNVLEHIPDPIAWIKKAKERLIGAGWLILEVPNRYNALAAVFDIPEFKSFWYRDAHVVYFDMNALAQALNSQGFEARVSLRQDYSLGNAFHWLFKGEPQANAQVARIPYQPVHVDHPAAAIVNRFLIRVDKEYRTLLDIIKACDTLCAVARKREI